MEARHIFLYRQNLKMSFTKKNLTLHHFLANVAESFEKYYRDKISEKYLYTFVNY